MLPSEAHLSLCICHVFSSTIGLVNVLSRIVACVRTGYFTEYLAHARTDCKESGNEMRVRNPSHKS